jgi:hypothetical protein
MLGSIPIHNGCKKLASAGGFNSLTQHYPETSRGHHNILEIRIMTSYTALLAITARAAKAEGQTSLAVARTVAATAWGWYYGAFFSEAAMARYEVAGRYLYTAAMIAYELGIMARRWVDAQVAEAQDHSLPVEAVEPLALTEVDATAKALASGAVFGTKAFSVAYSAVVLSGIVAILAAIALIRYGSRAGVALVGWCLCTTW